jgi:hypothetical protein
MKTFVYLLIAVGLFSCGPSGAEMTAKERPDSIAAAEALIAELEAMKAESSSDSTMAVLIETTSVVPTESVNIIPTQGSDLGFITYYIPDTMKVGARYSITLRISKHNTTELHANMDTNSVQAKVRIGHKMEARLTDIDSAFEFNTDNTPEQSVEMNESYTQWNWFVVPIKSGRHELRLIVVLKEGDIVKDIPVYENNIYVTASPLFTVESFFEENWKWIAGGIASAASSAFAWWWVNRRKKKSV